MFFIKLWPNNSPEPTPITPSGPHSRLTVWAARLSLVRYAWVGAAMKASSCSALIAILLVGCSPAGPSPSNTLPVGPIERLTVKLSQSSTNLMGFPNGPWHPVGLPGTAVPADIASRALQHEQSRHGSATNLSIVEVREVSITLNEREPRLYTAVLVNTEGGQKVVLLRGSLSAAGTNLLARVYDAP